MSRVINSYWVDERIRSQRVVPRAVSSFAPMQKVSLDVIGSRAEVRRRGGIIPSWVVFGMIILATFAICVTVTTRTRTRLKIASEQFVKIRTDVETLRMGNALLRVEVEKLRNAPQTIEDAARRRLNMVRANEIVVPIE